MLTRSTSHLPKSGMMRGGRRGERPVKTDFYLSHCFSKADFNTLRCLEFSKYYLKSALTVKSFIHSPVFWSEVSTAQIHRDGKRTNKRTGYKSSDPHAEEPEVRQRALILAQWGLCAQQKCSYGTDPMLWPKQ